MEAAADYGREYPAEKTQEFILLLASRDQSLLGKTVLLCKLPNDIAKKVPEANLLINRILKEHGDPEGVGLSIVQIDSIGNIILEDSIKRKKMLLKWNALLLAMYSKQD